MFIDPIPTECKSTKSICVGLNTNRLTGGALFSQERACAWSASQTLLHCGRPWPAAYINFNQNVHQIRVFTKPLCRAQAILYSLPNNERGTKYRGLTFST